MQPTTLDRDAPHDRVLVVGATGTVGRRLAACFRQTHAMVAATSRRANADGEFLPFDLRTADVGSLRLPESRYSFGVVSAGITKADECEQFPQATRAVNVDGTITLLERLLAADVVPVFLSSDYVFDGTTHASETHSYYDETSAVCPINEYGRQKVEVERFLTACGRPHLTVRLARVVTEAVGGGCILDEACSRLLAGCEYRAAIDQCFSMIYVDDVARLIDAAIAHRMRGLIHAAAPPATSRYELIRQVAAALQIDDAQVSPCRLEQIAGAAKRPLRTVLRSWRATNELRFAFTDPNEVLLQICAAHRARALPAKSLKSIY
ncbi:MAG: sugar nucleotide-binding protein [Planctomycetia bacterium]|nr:sugar nucleotide-binding protein [Planctomycetia bacterium]